MLEVKTVSCFLILLSNIMCAATGNIEVPCDTLVVERGSWDVLYVNVFGHALAYVSLGFVV